jgi:hypothetical protein
VAICDKREGFVLLITCKRSKQGCFYLRAKELVDCYQSPAVHVGLCDTWS